MNRIKKDFFKFRKRKKNNDIKIKKISRYLKLLMIDLLMIIYLLDR